MAGQWQTIANAPSFNASTMLLLTDGTVMCQEENGRNWWRLTPDGAGSYANGAWSTLAPMKDARMYYASAVLADGRVLVAGGEYAGGSAEVELNVAEIYDPLANQWSSLATPPGWTQIGDAPCCVLADGRVLLGSIGSTATAIYTPASNSWSPGGSKDDRSSEETWTLLPDGTVLTAECSSHPRSERYIPSTNSWISAGNVPADLVDPASIEIGPALLLPDGRVLALGSTGHTDWYNTPRPPNQPGGWTAGPDLPADPTHPGQLMQAKDAPACLLPNGRILCALGPAAVASDDYPGPTKFFEFNGTSFDPVPDAPNGGGAPYSGRMLLLPTGQVLFAAGSAQICIYTPDGTPDPAWKPEITDWPATLMGGRQYLLRGRQITGLSQAVSYGDDASMATNYPIVRLAKDNGKTWYCRTFNHSTMAVATGQAAHSTSFQTPTGIEAGPAQLVVIANGIASGPVDINVASQSPSANGADSMRKYSLVHDLASEIASDPSGPVATQIKADPVKALKSMAAPPLDVQHDKWVYRMIVGGLISIVLSAMAGTCLLLWHSGTISVESLTAMGSAAVGGLVGLLVPSPAQARNPQQ